MNKITHWLYGEKEYKVLVEKETKCNHCIHREVCDYKKEKRCSNYTFGRSDDSGCFTCSNHYARHDEKQPILCFHCNFFKKIDIDEYIFKDWNRLQYEVAYLPALKYNINLNGWIEVKLKDGKPFLTFDIDTDNLDYDAVTSFIMDNIGEIIYHSEKDDDSTYIFLDFIKTI